MCLFMHVQAQVAGDFSHEKGWTRARDQPIIYRSAMCSVEGCSINSRAASINHCTVLAKEVMLSENWKRMVTSTEPLSGACHG